MGLITKYKANFFSLTQFLLDKINSYHIIQQQTKMGERLSLPSQVNWNILDFIIMFLAIPVNMENYIFFNFQRISVAYIPPPLTHGTYIGCIQQNLFTNFICLDYCHLLQPIAKKRNNPPYVLVNKNCQTQPLILKKLQHWLIMGGGVLTLFYV